MKTLVHELQVHQIELEMQNDELRRAQVEIEESRSKYSDLYDFAPAGYFSLNAGGEIVRVNLTGACLLNIDREKLLHRLLSAFVEPSYQWVFTEHFRKAFSQGEGTHCELKMVREGGEPFHAFLNSISSNEGSAIRVRTIIADITDRKRAEEEVRHLNEELKQRNIDLKDSEDHLRLLSARLINIQETERRRTATEIHDSLGQSLNAIKFRFQETIRQLEAAAEEAAAEGERRAAAKQLRNLIPVIQTAIEEARRIQMDLRPSILDDLGIIPTISWFCREFQNTYTGIEVNPRIEIEENALPSSLKTVIFRVLQEAMKNAAKHSGASHVHLSLVKNGNNTELTVQDDGLGFDLDKTLSNEGKKRLGLTSMRERTEQSGGRFSIESARGKGTTVRMVWPM
jgi:PAS domain S-box-containing protein